MRSILIAEALFILMGGIMIAETPSIDWIKILGGSGLDKGYSMEQTMDKGYIIAGWTTSYGDRVHGDVYLVKTDSLGNPQWQKTFGGSGSDRGKSARQTIDKGYVIVGWTNTEGWGDTMNDNVYLIKTDSLGNLQWQNNFGDDDVDEGYSVQQTKDKGFIVGGISEDDGIYIIKTDSAGNLQWQKYFGGGADIVCDEGFVSVLPIDDGGYIIAGDIDCLIKIDSLGNPQWQKTLGPYLQLAPDNGYIIAVNRSNSLVKTDSLGNLQWEKHFGERSKPIAFRFVQLTHDKGYIVIGYINSGQTDTVGDRIYYDARNDDIYLIKTDSLGNTQWDWTYHQTYWDEGTSVLQTEDDSYIVLGNIYNTKSKNTKIYLFKIRAK